MDKHFFGLDKVAAHDENAAHLTTVHNEAELSIMRSILDSEQIPYAVRERGSGGAVKVIMGYSMFGTDIFVPKEMEEKAKELLDAFVNGEIVEDDEEIQESKNRSEAE